MVTDENRDDLEVFRDFFYDVTYEEDYLTGYGVKKSPAERFAWIRRAVGFAEFAHRGRDHARASASKRVLTSAGVA